jgi:hypothetical protein
MVNRLEVKYNWCPTQIPLSPPLRKGDLCGNLAVYAQTLPKLRSHARWFAFFILLDIVDEPMNGSSYAQCATPPCLPWRQRQEYFKTVQYSSVNLDAHVKSPFYMDLGI